MQKQEKTALEDIRKMWENISIVSLEKPAE